MTATIENAAFSTDTDTDAAEHPPIVWETTALITARSRSVLPSPFGEALMREAFITGYADGTGRLALFLPVRNGAAPDLFPGVPHVEVRLPADVVETIWRGLVAQSSDEPQPSAE